VDLDAAATGLRGTARREGGEAGQHSGSEERQAGAMVHENVPP
jgi:hypothetical protein